MTAATLAAGVGPGPFRRIAIHVTRALVVAWVAAYVAVAALWWTAAGWHRAALGADPVYIDGGPGQGDGVAAAHPPAAELLGIANGLAGFVLLPGLLVGVLVVWLLPRPRPWLVALMSVALAGAVLLRDYWVYFID